MQWQLSKVQPRPSGCPPSLPNPVWHAAPEPQRPAERASQISSLPEPAALAGARGQGWPLPGRRRSSGESRPGTGAPSSWPHVPHGGARSSASRTTPAARHRPTRTLRWHRTPIRSERFSPQIIPPPQC